MARNPTSREGGAGSRTNSKIQTLAPRQAPRVNASAGTGAQHHPIYQDTVAEYIPVRRSDLREISEFRWLETGTGAAGMFFLSGAFWLAVTLLVEHQDDLGKYIGGFALCTLSVLFGLALLYIAHRHFKMRETRIRGYFENEGSENISPS
jgi:hypothetical protein